MGKNSKARRPPIRRPIPAARLHGDRRAAARHDDLTEDHLVDGWLLPSGIRVRLARAEDIPAVQALTKLTGVDLEPEVTAAVEAGFAAAGLRAGLRAGKDGFTRHMGEQLFAAQSGDQRVPFQHATLVLVAEHDDQGVVAAVVAYPPIGVIQQLQQHAQDVGEGPQQALKILLAGATAIARIKALAVVETMRGAGIGAALLQRCWQVYDHCGYAIVYGQASPTPGLDRFYARHGFEVLQPGEGFDAWVVFGIHTQIRPDPDEQTFIRWPASTSKPRHRDRPVPAPRRPSRYDPGTLALAEGHLEHLLEHADGPTLAVQLPPLLWVKLAEGRRGNACVDACATLRYAYQQFGITADLVPVGVIVHETSGARTQYATDEPFWQDDTTFIGHTVLVLPELDKLVDPTVEQVPVIRALAMGPVIGRIPPDGRTALRQGGSSFGVPREGLLIEYRPVPAGNRQVLTDAPLLVTNAERYRRSGINLATLALDMFRTPGINERLRRAPLPRLHALLDAVGDAPLEPDDAGDMRACLPDGTGGIIQLRLDEIALPGAALPAPTRTWWGGRRRPL